MPTYRIADLLVQYTPQYPMTKTRSERYRVEDVGGAVQLGTNRELSEALLRNHPNLSPAECEYMQIGKEFYSLLLVHEGMLLHASAVVVDGCAYLFSAPSGTGKSTHTSLWLQKFGDKAYLLNDDKPAIRVLSDGIYAYGTPFSGKYDLSVNTHVPIRGIAFLERGETNHIQRISGREALYSMLNQTMRPRAVPLYTRLLRVVQKVTQTVPIYKLTCNMEPDAATLSYETMRKGESLS